MKRVSLLLLSIMFSLKPGYGAAETYVTSRIIGNANIVVDGDLRDWEWINALPMQIKNLVEYQKNTVQAAGDVFSSSFQCCIDKEKLYFSFSVNDPRRIFGRSSSASPFWDDFVELILYDCIADDYPETKIWISADSEGNTKLQGREPESISEQYPYIRSQWGIEAALAITENGYVCELSIPHASLSELIHWTEGAPLKANVRVYDDDSRGKRLYLDWAGSTSSAPEISGEFRFDELVASVFDADERSQGTVLEISVDLGEPDVLTDDKVLYLRNLESNMNIAMAFEKNKKYSWAIERHEDILKTSPPESVRIKSELSIARNSYFINDFARAETLCKKLLGYDADAKTHLDARMILLSIERTRNLDNLLK